MFEGKTLKDELQNAVIGAGILLGTIGLGERSALAQGAEKPLNNRATADLVTKEDQNILNTSSKVEVMSGALKGYKAPVYDGPVAWDSGIWSAESSLQAALAIGAFLGVVGAGYGFSITEYRRDRVKNSLLAGAILASTPSILFLGNCHIQEVNFTTTVQSVEKSLPPHNEKVGKTNSGPFFSQVISIPESNLVFATDARNAPFIDGQKINARVFVDGSGHIVGWTATAGQRPEK